MTIAVECEKFTLGVATPGPVGLFAQASYHAMSGQTTIFAGAKAGEDLPAGFGGSSQTGSLSDDRF